MSKKMYITITVIALFVVALLVVMFLFPGKTEKDIPVEADEKILFQADGLEVIRYPATGPRFVSWPGSKLVISNKRIIISQKGLGSSTYVVREIMLNEAEPNQTLSGKKNWGNVLLATVNYKEAFSLKDSTVLLKNPKAINLDRFEIKKLPNPEAVLNAVK